MRKAIALLFCVFCKMLPVSAQSIYSASATGSENDVVISWTINEGNQCADITVEHGTDSNLLTTIYTYPGICGQVDQKVTYSFVHHTPVKNASNYYQIKYGNTETSQILTVFVRNFGSSAAVISPVPVQLNSIMYISSQVPLGATVHFSDINGKELKQAIVDKNRQIKVGALNLAPGLVVYYITADNQLYGKGKMVVAPF